MMKEQLNEVLSDKDFDINEWLKNNNHCADSWQEILDRDKVQMEFTHFYNVPYVSSGIVEYIPITIAELYKYEHDIDNRFCLAYSKAWTQNPFNQAHVRAIQFILDYDIRHSFVDLNDYTVMMDLRSLEANSAYIIGIITSIKNRYGI